MASDQQTGGSVKGKPHFLSNHREVIADQAHHHVVERRGTAATIVLDDRRLSLEFLQDCDLHLDETSIY